MTNNLTSQILAPELDLTPALTWQPKKGELVENFGCIARVIEVRPAPYNDVLLKDIRDGQKWAANPNLCRPVR